MCSFHFVDMKGPTKHHTIPSIFPSKVFKTSVCMHVDSMFCMQAIKKTDHEIDGVLYIVHINALQRKNKYMTFCFISIILRQR